MLRTRLPNLVEITKAAVTKHRRKSLLGMPPEQHHAIVLSVTTCGEQRLDWEYVLSPYVVYVNEDGSKTLRDFHRDENVTVR